jgi:hypothetical protein
MRNGACRLRARRRWPPNARPARPPGVEAANEARLEALEVKRKARLLQLENARRAKGGLPPLEELPE